jgi:quercetin dioxygenase-like cupin family protein
MKRDLSIAVACGIALAAGVALGQDGKPGPGARNPSEMKFGPIPGLPTCFEGSVQQGDPMTTAFTVHAKVKTGCAVPWHWHSANEQLIVVSGTARVAMMGQGKPVALHAGGFAMMPAKHVHQARCEKNCTLYILSDGKFDIHYVDPQGKEISPEQALKPIDETVARR